MHYRHFVAAAIARRTRGGGGTKVELSTMGQCELHQDASKSRKDDVDPASVRERSAEDLTAVSGR